MAVLAARWNPRGRAPHDPHKWPRIQHRAISSLRRTKGAGSYRVTSTDDTYKGDDRMESLPSWVTRLLHIRLVSGWVANHDMGDCRRGSGDIAAVAGLQERSASWRGRCPSCLSAVASACWSCGCFPKNSWYSAYRWADLSSWLRCVLRAVGTAGDDHRARPARPAPDGRGAHPIRAGLHRAPYRLDLRGVSDHRLADRLFVISSAQHVAHAEGTLTVDEWLREVLDGKLPPAAAHGKVYSVDISNTASGFRARTAVSTCRQPP